MINGTDFGLSRVDSEAIWCKFVDAEGNLVSLVTGDTVYFTVKDDIYTKEIRLQKIVNKFDDGRAHIDIKPENTKDWAYKEYVYDVQVTFADDTVKTVITPSLFVVEGEVTHD